MTEVKIDATVNGEPAVLTAPLDGSLLHAMRDAGLLSPKAGCEEGRCGTCSVRLEGDVVYACLVPAVRCDGARVDTAEGGVPEDLADALVAQGAVQCGFCTPGFVLAIEDLLSRVGQRSLTEQDVRAALSGNLCRCTGYSAIVAAVLDVHQGRRQQCP
jgi:aerobic-type carbon monoxide dehydrogenase small subunit (CoxS/CutS family)